MDLAIQKVPESLKDEYIGYLTVLEAMPSEALALALYARGVDEEQVKGYFYQFGECNG